MLQLHANYNISIENYRFNLSNVQKVQRAILYISRENKLYDSGFMYFDAGFMMLVGPIDQCRKAIKYLQNGLTIACKILYIPLEVQCASYLALAYRRTGNVIQARQAASHALRIAQSADIPVYQSLAKSVLAWTYFINDELSEANRYCKKADAILKDNNINFPFCWTYKFVEVALEINRSEAYLPSVLTVLQDISANNQAQLPYELQQELKRVVEKSQHIDDSALLSLVKSVVNTARIHGYV